MNWDFSTIKDKNKAASVKDQLDGISFSTLTDGDQVYAGNKYIYKDDVYLAKETHELFEDSSDLFFDVSKFDLITKSANIAMVSQTGLGIDFSEGDPISINRQFGGYEISRANDTNLQHIGIVHKVLSSAAIQIALEGLIKAYGGWDSGLAGGDYYVDGLGEYTQSKTNIHAFKVIPGSGVFISGIATATTELVQLGDFIPNDISLTQSGRYNSYSPQSNISLNILEAFPGAEQSVRITLTGQSITVPNNSVILNDSFQDGVPPNSGTYVLVIKYNGSEYEFELKRVTIKEITPDKTTLLHFMVMGQSQALGDDGRPKLGHSTDPNVLMLGDSQRIDQNLTEGQIKSLTLNTCIEGIPNVDTIAVAFGRQLLNLINDPKYRICVTISGQGGRDIVALTKNGSEGTYEAAFYAAQRVKELSDLNDWNYEVHHIWMHGGNAGIDYYNQLVAHINNFRTDFGAITTQTRPIWVVMDQIRQRNNFTIEPSHKMVEVMQDLNNVIISHPRYVVEYHVPGTLDSIHLTSNGYRHTACFFALAAYRKLFNLEYHSLVIDNVVWNASEGKFIISFNNTGQLFGSGNYGLRLYNITNEESIAIDNIALVNNRVELTPANISVGEYTIRIETMFRDSDEEWKWYPDFDLDPELGYLYERDSYAPIFVDTNTDQPYRMDRFLLRSRTDVDIEITDSGENQAPTAFDLHITNTNPATGDLEVGKVLGAGYTFNDFDGDQEGNSTIKWFIADDDQGANEQTVSENELVLNSSHLGKYIDFEVTPIAQTGVIQGEPVRLGYQGPVVPLSVINLGNRRVQVHLDRHNSPDDTQEGNYFNGIGVSSVSPGQITATTLLDNDKNSLPISMKVITPAWGQATTSNLHADISEFPYPESVIRNLAGHNKFHPEGCTIEFETNWDENKTYKITCYGTTNKEANPPTVVTDVRVQGNSKLLETWQNINDVVVFDGVEPDNDGKITVSFAKADGQTIYSTVLNLIIIEESDVEPGENLPPSASNVSFTGSLVENNTITATWDYNDPDGDAEGDSIVKFIIADDEEGTNEIEEQSGTSNEFTLSESYIGKYLDIRVTPYAAVGESPGNEVSMGFIGPILEEGEVVTPPVLLRRNKAQAGNWIGNMGFWEFQPRNFNPNQQYPILIFFHGAGEPGNGIEDLDILITPGKGLGSVINKDVEAFADKVGDMVCIVPQCFTWSWPGHQGRLPVEAALQQSYIDSNRIYMTGLSAGGWGIHELFGIPEIAAVIAAAVPIATKWTTHQLDNNYMNNALHVPFWYFHGTADTSTNRYADIKTHIEMFNGLNPTTPAKLTGMIGRGHTASVWDNVYDDNRNASLSLDEPYEVGWNQSIYDWLKQFVLGQTPVPQLNTPGSFNASSASSTSLALTWTDPNDNPNEVNFEINYRVQGTPSWTQKIVAQDATSDTLSGLANSTTYECRVRALGDDENSLDSPWSSTVTATTGQQTQLATPSGFNIVPGNENNTISWNAVPNAEEYELEFHDGDENWAAVPGYNGTSISGIEHTGLTNGTEYFYRVKATAEGYTDSEFATSSGTPAASGPIWEARIHLNGNNQGSAPDYYNGTAIGGEAADPDETVIADLLDVNQDPTGVTMVVVNPAWQISTSSAHTSIGNFPYPEEVVQQHSAENSFMNQGPAEFYFGNLPEGTYRVTCYGYFNYTEPVLTEFEVNGNSQTLDCNDNVDDTVVFNNVEPDENDRINIRFGKPEGYGLTFSTANLIILERLT